MKKPFNTLNTSQQEFLALYRLLDQPVSIFASGLLSPILPGPFMELVSAGDSGSWLVETDENQYRLSDNLLPDELESLGRINTPDRVKQIAERIIAEKLVQHFDPYKVLGILGSVLFNMELVDQLERIARLSIDEKNHFAAQVYFEQSLSNLIKLPESNACDRRIIAITLDFSNLHYALGREQEKLSQMLLKAGEAARRIGDRRSESLINLHIGRLLHVSGQHAEALSVLSAGLSDVESLGDDDIKAKSAVFFGIYYYIQGRFGEALPYFETSIQQFQTCNEGIVNNPSAPIFLGYSAAYLGRFSESIGSLASSWKLAVKREDSGLAATIRAVLGTILVMAGKAAAAATHLECVIDEAVQSNNHLALYLARGGMAVMHYLENNLEASFRFADEAISEGMKSGFVRQYTSPWILEMLFEYNRHGYQIKRLEFKQEISKIMKGANIHLKGVALRLTAPAVSKSPAPGEEPPEVLIQSAEYLKRSGDPVQQAKTRLAIARFYLQTGRKRLGSEQVQKAWNQYSEVDSPYFPEDLSSLVKQKSAMENRFQTRENFLSQTLEIVNQSSTPSESDQALLHLVRSISRTLKSERAAIFWIDQSDIAPQLKASINLFESDTEDRHFAIGNSQVRKCIAQGKPVLLESTGENSRNSHDSPSAVLCLPVCLESRVKGVIYLDYCYLENPLEHLDDSLLGQMADHFSHCIRRIIEFSNLQGERNSLASEKSLRIEQINREEIIAENAGMLKILKQAEKAAASDSTILIMGESGVGKELLARRVHRQSPRENGPYIIVDIAGIPENLMESELFGHEKGAFTGADKQKQGRIELAHNGTLFIDEIGEISKSIQVKLLRVLQEKTFVRVGGTRTITSDFRLITATNRDLENEVASGHFREDLFYRLNVLPIVLPPLKDRDRDIVLLAHYFWKHYLRKYNRKDIDLTARDEKELLSYHWPGNIRELKNVIERAVILSSGQNKEISLPQKKRLRSNHPFADAPTMDKLQVRYIKHVLDKTDGRISGKNGAASILGMKRQTLYARMRKLGIR